MSCPSSQNALILNVSMGQLPEGFCPPNLQELANAIAARIIIAPSEASLLIVGGGTEPASNVGPWFKNCEELFVFDETIGRYRPVTKGGFDNFQVFNSSGTFIVPDNVFKIQVEGWGAGAGGHDSVGGSSSAGGGGGGYGKSIKAVNPGDAIAVTVGVGGVNGTPGTDGGDTIILGMNCGGGKATAAHTDQALGGTTTGSDLATNGGASEGPHGGAGGAGGDSPLGSQGGTPGPVVAARTPAQPGGGGCGSTVAIHITGSSGASGRAVIYW